MGFEEAKKLVIEHVDQIIADLASVQPMDPTLMKRMLEAASTEDELVQNGYEPVSSHRLLWIKKEDKK